MKKNSSIKISFFNADKKREKAYSKFFVEEELTNASVKIEEIKRECDLELNEKLLNDYVKLEYLYENGGLLIDGNFEFISSLKNFYMNEFFIAFCDTENISTNIMFAKSSKNEFIKNILDEIKKGDIDNLTDIISKLSNKDLRHNFNGLVKLDNGILIYPYDYFYPIDYERIGKTFSDNTKAIYYEKGLKIPFKIKSKRKVLKSVSPSSYKYFLSMLSGVKNSVGYRKYLLQQDLKKHFTVKADPNIENTLAVLDKYIEENKKSVDGKLPIDYIIIHNPRWLGVTSATKELFENLLPLEEVYIDDNAEKIAEKIVESKVSQVIFSAFDYGWDRIATKIKAKNKDIKIKSFWHGSHSQVIEKINWETNVMVINLHKKGIIDVMGTCKESMLNFYKAQGYKAAFIQNTVNFTDDIKNKLKEAKKKDNGNINVGLYSAGTDWRKNTYTQVMATSLFDNAVLELVPLRYEVQMSAAKNGLKTVGEYSHLKREDLLVKMAENDINIYVTFSECAPMLPIESLEAGTVCLTGNNHHYFNNTKLYDYLVVEREDDVVAIYEKMKFALENKEEILSLYKEWKEEYDKVSIASVKEFLEM